MFDISIYYPETTLSNDDLHREFPDWKPAKIAQKLGIDSRHVVKAGETALTLAENAAKKLLTRHPELSEEVDFLLFCTQSPEYFLPSGACILQQRLNLKTTIGAFDYNLGCSGFIYGLAMAKGFLGTGIAQNVLLITAETYSRYLHAQDRGNRSIFGDAGAATIIRKRDLDRIGAFTLGTDGRGAENLIVRNGCSHAPYDPGAPAKEAGAKSFYTDNHLYMNGPEVFNFTIEAVPELIEATLQQNNLKKDEVDFFILHQANSFMLHYLRTLLDIPEEKFYVEMRESGNTVSATVPIALEDVMRQGRLRQGDKVLLAGFGVGYSYGATIITI